MEERTVHQHEIDDAVPLSLRLDFGAIRQVLEDHKCYVVREHGPRHLNI